MSAKIAAVNQTRNRSDDERTDRTVTISVIDVAPNSVPPPPSYEQAISIQSEIERQRIEAQQRALEDLVHEQNRMAQNRIEQQNRTQDQYLVQQPPRIERTQAETRLQAPPQPQIIQHVYNAAPRVGPYSTNVTCPSCHAAIKTRIEYSTSTKTHLGAFLCCVVFWPCALCPYFTKSCHDALHYCPSCNAYIGAHRAHLNEW